MLPFNSDGPTRVSEDGFEAFRKLTDGMTFEQLFYLWIDENYPQGVRLLCLRNMLRQTTTDYTTRAFMQTGSNFSQLLSVEKRFFWQLKNRPVLLGELTNELLYALNEGLIDPCQDTQQAKDQLIELMVSFLRERDGRTLASHHTLWQKSNKASEDIAALLVNWSNLYRITWLREELWHAINSVLEKEIDIYHDELMESRSISELRSAAAVPPVALMSTFKFINSYATRSAKSLTSPSKPTKTTAPLAQLLSLLDQKLPSHFCYSTAAETMRIATTLDDLKIAYSYMRRHLINTSCLDESAISSTREWTNFLLWAYGMQAHYNSNDTELYDTLMAHLSMLESQTA